MSVPRKAQRGQSHIPTNSVFFDKVVPILLVIMALATATFIVIAAGVVLGFVPFR